VGNLSWRLWRVTPQPARENTQAVDHHLRKMSILVVTTSGGQQLIAAKLILEIAFMSPIIYTHHQL